MGKLDQEFDIEANFKGDAKPKGNESYIVLF